MVMFNKYICNKYYIVEYHRDYDKYSTEGILLHYNNGNIILLNVEGIYYLRHSDIEFMKPIQPNYNVLNDEYKKVLKDFGYKECLN